MSYIDEFFGLYDIVADRECKLRLLVHSFPISEHRMCYRWSVVRENGGVVADSCIRVPFGTREEALENAHEMMFDFGIGIMGYDVED